MSMKNPPHPGLVVWQECIEPLGLSITDAAMALGGDAQHAVGVGERQTGHFVGNGRAAGQGVWRDRGRVARGTSAL